MVRNGLLFRIFAALIVAAAVPLSAQEPNVYAWIHIAPDPMDPGLELPRQYKREIEKHLGRQLTRRLPSMTVVPSDSHPPEIGGGILLSWTVLEFSPGDQQIRRQIGLGFGTTRIAVRYRFTDASTGLPLLEGHADGKVIGGWFDGGDSLGAAEGLAKEIAGDAGRKLPR